MARTAGHDADRAIGLAVARVADRREQLRPESVESDF